MPIRFVVIAFMIYTPNDISSEVEIMDLVVGVYEDKETAEQVAKEHNRAQVFEAPYYKVGN